METLTFNCKILTPMFLAGADGRTPELRAASIKGAMRFWWRACNGHLRLDDLRKQEQAIFGGVGDGKASRSKVVVRVSSGEPLRIEDVRPLPHSTERNKQYRNPAIVEGQSFVVQLSLVEKEVKLNGQVIFDQKVMKSLFRLLSVLGGLGKRSRRAFGSFQIIEEHINVDYVFSLLANLNKDHFEQNSDRIFPKFAPQEQYPSIKEINIGGSSKQNIPLLVSQATHDIKGKANPIWKYNNAMGHASRGRFASPVLTSCFEREGKLFPTLTIMHTFYERHGSVETLSTDELQIQQDFKDKILP